MHFLNNYYKVISIKHTNYFIKNIHNYKLCNLIILNQSMFSKRYDNQKKCIYFLLIDSHQNKTSNYLNFQCKLYMHYHTTSKYYFINKSHYYMINIKFLTIPYIKNRLDHIMNISQYYYLKNNQIHKLHTLHYFHTFSILFNNPDNYYFTKIYQISKKHNHYFRYQCTLNKINHNC